MLTPAQIHDLPKVELHLHIEGTLEPELIMQLAERNGIRLPWADIEELRRQYEFTDLQSFLNLYYANMAVLQTEADFADLTRAYLRRAQAAGVRHAEIFMDPQAHTVRGVDLATCVNGVASAIAESEAEFGVSSALIVTFLRDREAAEALTMMHDLIEMRAPIVGIGLDSAEVGHPPIDFVEVFALAREHGLQCVAHAGEEGPPAYVWQALELLQVSRIDHGIRSLEDELVEHLVKHQIPLTVCPFSNVRLRVVDTLADHPLPAMLARGLAVTVNSDDPAYFGGYLDDNFTALTDTLSFGAEEVATLARNAVRASFLTADAQAPLLMEINEWLSAQL
ncbi:adenosine deaminase [Cryobacterium psychrotolerans]|uniref:Adenine deaminase n=1 Tax=Cryobacterium psychrotolerans TaxID=386301 RepID=A0A1G9FT88_9MICO|nr:adenosine deaminase [Cryobacterium psychrotolerans]TFD90613.1 adenosine deaminase [Cryobacterium psychrotolerans]SDK91353.1 adenosine deaminase [Cryobacterium psychrotolerans]